jgi:hypothetical protein
VRLEQRRPPCLTGEGGGGPGPISPADGRRGGGTGRGGHQPEMAVADWRGKRGSGGRPTSGLGGILSPWVASAGEEGASVGDGGGKLEGGNAAIAAGREDPLPVGGGGGGGTRRLAGSSPRLVRPQPRVLEELPKSSSKQEIEVLSICTRAKAAFG